MIAVNTDGKLLKIEEAEEMFNRVLPENEEWKIYSDLKSMLPDKDKIDIVFNASRKLQAEELRKLCKLRWIFSYSAGVEHYPLDELEKSGVILSNTSGVHAKNIAEQVMGAMIMFSRNLFAACENQKKKIYDREIPLGELSGQNLLIIGTGSIGREIARKAKAFDMNVTGIRNRSGRERPKYFDAVYTADSLEEQLGGVQYIVCVVPSTDKTRGLFNRDKFELMSRDAVFINVGRGDLIDERALIEALKTKRIRGAYLDVFPTEPIPENSEFWDLDNLLITPHNAGRTPNYLPRSMEIFLENLKRFRKGEELINRIDCALKY